MADKTPIRLVFTDGSPTGIAEYQAGDTIANQFLSNSGFTLVDDSSTVTTISLGESMKIGGDTGITTTISGDNISIDLDDTAVTPGSYGSATSIPTFTVDQQGRLTAAGSASVATDLTIVDDSSTSATISLLTDTLKINGTSNEIETSISGDNITIGLPNDVTIGNDLTVTGDLTVNGTTTTVNSTTIEITNSFTFEGSTADANETTLGVIDPTADRTINLPNASGTIVLKDTTDTLTNKSIDLANNTLTGSLAEFNSALQSESFAGLAATQTLTNKTINGPDNTLTNIANSSLSNSTITLAGDSGSNAVDLGDTLTVSGDTGITTSVSGDTVSVDLDDTTVTAGSYGSTTQIPTFTVDQQGRLTAASTVSVATQLDIVDDSSSSLTIDLLTDTLKISGDTGITTSVSGDTLSIDLDDTAVTPGSYGSATAIPTFTVDQQGRLTAAGTANVATDLTIVDDSSTSATISLLTDTLSIKGTSNEVNTSISGDTVTIGLPDDVTIGQDLTVTRNAVITGNLTVNGTTTTVNSSTIEITNSFTFEGATADAYETTLGVVDPTADRTIDLPNASGTIVLKDTTDTLTNKTISGSSNTLSNIGNSSLSNSTITLAGDSGSNAVDLGDTLTISGDTGITTSVSGDTVSVDLDDTAVTPGSYGSTTQIPTFTVDQQGRMTAAGVANVATDLTIVDDSSTSATISLLTDTLKIIGTSNEVETSISGDSVIVGLPNDVTISNDLTVNGSTSLTGNVTLGNASSDTISVTGRFGTALVPDTNITYDLGTSSLRWRDIYLSGNTIDLNGATISGDGTGSILISASGATLPAGSLVGTDTIASADTATGLAVRNVPFYTAASGLSSVAKTFKFSSGSNATVFTENQTFTLASGTNASKVALFVF